MFSLCVKKSRTEKRLLVLLKKKYRIDYCYYPDGRIRYKRQHNNNKVHRVDGPALICYYENGLPELEAWHFNGKLNRLDGPA